MTSSQRPLVVRIRPDFSLRAIAAFIARATFTIFAAMMLVLLLVFAAMVVQKGVPLGTIVARLGEVPLVNWGRFALTGMVAVTLFFLMGTVSMWFDQGRTRRVFRRRFPELAADPEHQRAMAALRRVGPIAFIGRGAVRAARALAIPDQRVRIYVRGEEPVPEVPDAAAEPLVVRRDALLATSVTALLLCGGGVLTVVLDQNAERIPVLMEAAAASGATALLWVIWRLGFAPRYVRILPGNIQRLTYGLRGEAPTIEDFPLQPGACVFVSQLGFAVRITVVRDKQQFAFPLLKRGDNIERLWLLLRSTAAVGPLGNADTLS